MYSYPLVTGIQFNIVLQDICIDFLIRLIEFLSLFLFIYKRRQNLSIRLILRIIIRILKDARVGIKTFVLVNKLKLSYFWVGFSVNNHWES